MNLNQVTVSVKDVELCTTFYQKLGLKLIVRSLPHYARFECPQGDTTFSLHLAAPEETIQNSTWVYFETADPDKRISELISAGIPIDEMPEDKPWLWREARLKDPSGNIIIIYSAGKNRKDPPWKIQ